jgi:hypothetical protein
MRFKFTRTPPILAAFLLIYSAVADRIERSWISLSARQRRKCCAAPRAWAKRWHC